MRSDDRRFAAVKSRGGLGILALTGLFVLLTGCRAMNPLPTFGVGQTPPDEDRIRKLMKWHSGRVEVYREFRTVFTARAVFLSEEIQRSVVEFESKSNLLNPDERLELEQRVRKGGSGIQILLGFYTPEEELNDLAGEDAAWIPYVTGRDGTITRASCFGLEDEDARIYMKFMEWDLSWSRLYVLCFPAGTDPGQEDGWIDLVISGSQGRGELRLKTIPPHEAP